MCSRWKALFDSFRGYVIFLFGKNFVSLTPNLQIVVMIVSVISKYLESNKRIVVPNLGAFIVKVAGEKVLFSNLIKGDDGVLRQLLIKNGLTELEAAATIDRFVFEVNSRLESMGVCELSGLGKLSKGVNGTLSFEYAPAVRGEVLDGGAAEYVAEKSANTEQQVEPEPEVEIEIVGDELETAPETEPKAAESEVVVAESQEPMSSDVMAESDANAESELREGYRSARNIYDESPRTVSTVTQPADYVKGLRYGKGRRDLSGRDYALKRKKSAFDLVMKLAIGAAVLATLALAYGLWNDWRNGNLGGGYDEEPMELIEEPQSMPEGEIRNPDLDYITPKK